MPAQSCKEHAIIFQDSIGLPGKDDPCISEKVTFFEFSKTRFQTKQKQFPIDQDLEG